MFGKVSHSGRILQILVSDQVDLSVGSSYVEARLQKCLEAGVISLNRKIETAWPDNGSAKIRT